MFRSILEQPNRWSDLSFMHNLSMVLRRPYLYLDNDVLIKSPGESGLDGTPLLPKPVDPAALGDAIQAMYDALTATPPGTAWLVATGALTNVALLFDAHPELPAHIAGLSVMGGAVGGGFSSITKHGEPLGNIVPHAEFNVRRLSMG